MPVRCLSFWVGLSLVGRLALGRTPTQDALIYSEVAGEKLTMDYYAASGPAPHPIAIIIHGGGFLHGTSKNDSEAYCADFLAPAGYAVFSINYRLAPKYRHPAMLDDVGRAIRFIRHYASEWNADPNRIALVGGSAGGFLSNMAGLLNPPGDMSARDPVDHESARVQAVVTLFSPSDFRRVAPDDNIRVLFEPVIRQKGEAAALAEASPITHVNRDAPPFLFIHGDKDETVPISQSIGLQKALQAAGVRADLIRIPNAPHATVSWHTVPGIPDWERQMIQWLNDVMHHKGRIGEGIRPRAPQP